MFCPKCGSILLPKKENNKRILACSCGYKLKDTKNSEIKEVIHSKDKDVEVIDRPDIETLPKTTIECPKCQNKEAFFWTLQTRASDEPETKFLRCCKCSHTWRDYS